MVRLDLPYPGDFGLTREGSENDETHRFVSRARGTPCYLPEEYLHGKKLSYEVDVYSFGLVSMPENLRERILNYKFLKTPPSQR